ncbi:hypothetical protein [Rhizobium mesoamericanum]|uniref:hypothetical protein n=1 Tax=Rhizobium mesoamericanum TaxID=1079800 RepID=UPI0002FB3EF6
MSAPAKNLFRPDATGGNPVRCTRHRGRPSRLLAAIEAAAANPTVVLVDKGYFGSSGATASAGTQIWYVPPDPEKREAAMASREAMGG